MENLVAVQWERIEAQLQKHVALEEHSQPFFNPGTTDEEIVLAEKTVGVHFPEDLRASLKRHNGQARGEGVIGNCSHGPGIVMSTQDIVMSWSSWKRLHDRTFQDGVEGAPDPGVKTDWWNPRWIPITQDGCGDHYCLDMDPAEGGTVGQIIYMIHDDDMRRLQAPSFLSMLTTTASNMEAGTLTWKDGVGYIPQRGVNVDSIV